MNTVHHEMNATQVNAPISNAPVNNAHTFGVRPQTDAEANCRALMDVLNLAMQGGDDALIDQAARAINACWRRIDAEGGAA